RPARILLRGHEQADANQEVHASTLAAAILEEPRDVPEREDHEPGGSRGRNAHPGREQDRRAATLSRGDAVARPHAGPFGAQAGLAPETLVHLVVRLERARRAGARREPDALAPARNGLEPQRYASVRRHAHDVNRLSHREEPGRELDDRALLPLHAPPP